MVSDPRQGDMGWASASTAHRVFQLVDRDGDGRLTAEEFGQENREVLFSKQDTNGNDRLTLEEFSVWCSSPEAKAAARRRFAQKDSDGDGVLRLREYIAP